MGSGLNCLFVCVGGQLISLIEKEEEKKLRELSIDGGYGGGRKWPDKWESNNNILRRRCDL